MFVYVNKPRGVTSFDIVYQIRKRFEKQKVGHSGTLDPFATGLMILAVGKDTKNLHKFITLDKEYIAKIDFSKDSDTRDMEYRNTFSEHEIRIEKNEIKGIILDGKKIEKPSKNRLIELLDKIIPNYNLPLPAFSAKKVKGKRLYEMARRGNINKEFRDMKIYEYEILKYEFPIAEIRFKVGSGTYIRSIAYRLGRQTLTGGILAGLVRTNIGDYNMAKMNFDEKIIFEKKGKEYEMIFKAEYL